MRLRLPLIAIGATSILAMSAGSVLAIPIPGTLDAHQTSWDTNLPAPVEIQAQTFVPTISGSLGTVLVHTNTFVPPPPPGVAGPAVVPNVTNVTVAIFPTSGGYPTGSALATQVIAPVDDGWSTVSFASPASVVAGTKYAIELAQGATDTTRWDFLCDDAYGPGQAIVLDGTWKTIHQYDGNLDCLADFAFQTYIVTPPPATTIPPTSTAGGNSSDTPSLPNFLLIFAGLASAAVFVTISRRTLTQR